MKLIMIAKKINILSLKMNELLQELTNANDGLINFIETQKKVK